ncbi:hypothetical protein S245_013724, partial [Arachis hypogaea]
MEMILNESGAKGIEVMYTMMAFIPTFQTEFLKSQILKQLKLWFSIQELDTANACMGEDKHERIPSTENQFLM